MDAPTPNPHRLTRWHVPTLLLLSVGIHAVLIARSETIARDTIGFVRLALHLETPPDGLSRLDVLREAAHPPGYPLSVLAVSQPVRALSGGVTCDSMTLSAQLAAAIAAVLLVIPMYRLGRRMFDAQTSLLATGLFQVLPVFARTSSDGLSDSTYLLVLVVALWLGVRAVQRPSWPRFLGCGLACGTAYLVRPEGLILAGTLGLSMVILARRWSWSFRRQLLPFGAALTAGVLIVAVPYMAAIGKVSNKPTWNRITESIGGHSQSSDSARTALPLATWWDDAASGQSKPIWAVQALGAELLKTSHFAPGLLAILGIWWIVRRGRAEPAHALLLAFLAVETVVLWGLAVKMGYVSERHTLPVVLVGCFFAAAALKPFADWVSGWALFQRGDGRFWYRSIILVLAVACLPAALKERLHEQREGNKRAGLYLREHASDEDVIWDPFRWSEFYAGRAWGYDDDRKYADDSTVFVVVQQRGDQPTSPDSKVPMYAQALVMMTAGRPVFEWPEDADDDTNKVVVYRVDR